MDACRSYFTLIFLFFVLPTGQQGRQSPEALCGGYPKTIHSEKKKQINKIKSAADTNEEEKAAKL